MIYTIGYEVITPEQLRDTAKFLNAKLIDNYREHQKSSLIDSSPKPFFRSSLKNRLQVIYLYRKQRIVGCKPDAKPLQNAAPVRFYSTHLVPIPALDRLIERNG